MILALGNIELAVAAVLVAILGIARLTRAIVYDDFPPSVWWRMTWERWMDRGPWWRMWTKLFTCWWCLSFWVALFCIGWWMLTIAFPVLIWTWWVFWGGLALAYVATMVIVRDTPKE